MALENSGIVIQGSFPGNKPHASVLLSARHLPDNRLIQQRPGTFNNAPPAHKINSNQNTYQLDAKRLTLNTPGKPMPENVLQKMEKVFNADFSNVRIHTGDRQAESIGALAFTTGNNIYFASGLYNPNTPHGQRMLGHELAHVVQQKAGRVKNPFGSGAVVVQEPGFEAEAERMGFQVYQKFNMPPEINSQPPLLVAQMKRLEGKSASFLVAKMSGVNTASARFKIPAAAIRGIHFAEYSEVHTGISSGKTNDIFYYYYQKIFKYKGAARNDAEMKLVSWLANSLYDQYGNRWTEVTGTALITSDFGPCKDCRRAINWLKRTVPNLTITVSYKSEKKVHMANRYGKNVTYGHESATGSSGSWSYNV
jgi:hypothetical protein